jgi:hypothetical protein
MNPFTSGSPSSFSAQLLSSDLSLISFWFRGNRNEFVPFVSVQQVSPYWFGSLDIRWNGFWGFGQEQQTIFHTSKSYRGEFCIFIFIHLLYLFSFCYGHRSIFDGCSVLLRLPNTSTCTSSDYGQLPLDQKKNCWLSCCLIKSNLSNLFWVQIKLLISVCRASKVTHFYQFDLDCLVCLFSVLTWSHANLMNAVRLLTHLRFLLNVCHVPFSWFTDVVCYCVPAGKFLRLTLNTIPAHKAICTGLSFQGLLMSCAIVFQ